jgi:hypothetical protein
MGEMVRQCLRACGRSEKKEKIKTDKENPEWKIKSEINTELTNNSDSQPAQDTTFDSNCRKKSQIY